VVGQARRRAGRRVAGACTEPRAATRRRITMRSVRTAVLAFVLTAVAIVAAGCATPAGTAAQLSSVVPSSAPPASSPNAALSSAAAGASPWGSQDTTLAAARRIACGPKPTAQPRPASPSPSRQPVPGQIELTDLTLVPPPSGTKPATCADVALDVLRTGGFAPVGSAQPAKVWLAILSAPTPASVNADASDSPYFTDVLAWVFYFDDLPPLCPAGGPAVSGSAAPIECDPASLGPSSAILSVDATTAEPLTNVESGGPILP